MTGRLLAYAQLVRLPNVFTAFADILLCACAVYSMTGETGPFVWVLLASGCLYCSGMAWNDYFDRADDAKTRPNRPIPSGRIRPATARLVGMSLMLMGGVFAFVATDVVAYKFRLLTPRYIAGFIAIAVLLYDAWLKRTPFGPLGMGTCRFLNVFLGLSLHPSVPELPVAYHLASVIGLYIVGVTWFARTEEGTSQKTHLLVAFVVMIAALFLALMVPLQLQEGTVTPLYPYLLIAFGFWIGLPVASAIQRPTPKPVQLAVKRCILGLVLLDAILATAFVGPAGLLIGLLLIPAHWLGKWVYST
jgi:4-hydroxybenzoate polyprenyltransferase